MLSLEKGMDQVHHVLKADQMANIALKMLACINREAVLHSVRTAYLAYKTVCIHPMNPQCMPEKLVMLALFHTLGYFREDIHFNYFPHEANLEYFSNEKSTESKYVFACYYLEYMTPLKSDAVGLQNFLEPYNKDLRQYVYQEEYKDVIYLCARVSDYIVRHPNNSLPSDLNDLAPGHFDPEYVKAFTEANKDNILINTIRAGAHVEEVTKVVSSIQLPDEANLMLEKMLIHLLDFKSTSTMKHSINTSSYALSLGLRMELNSRDLTTLYNAAFLHDFGKMATPQRILEFPGKLSPEDMGIMRHHVNHSKRILNGYVDEDILETVYTHHEKLNGKGYPRHLEGKDLNLIQRILTVADITSALHDSRSYKGEFNKEKILSIIKDMTDKGELDPQITKFVIEDFDRLVKEQQFFQGMLAIDFSKVIINYNNYIYEDVDLWVENLLNATTPYEEIEDIEELDDLEDLEEL